MAENDRAVATALSGFLISTIGIYHYVDTPMQYSAVFTAVEVTIFLYESRCEKTGLRGFRPGPTQTGLHSHRRWQEAGNFGFRK